MWIRRKHILGNKTHFSVQYKLRKDEGLCECRKVKMSHSVVVGGVSPMGMIMKVRVEMGLRETW